MGCSRDRDYAQLISTAVMTAADSYLLHLFWTFGLHVLETMIPI
jgi:hypothetical protein